MNEPKYKNAGEVFRAVLGESAVKPLEIKRKRVEIPASWPNAVVRFETSRVQCAEILEASIGETVRKKTYGVLPNDGNGGFNCCVGEYYDEFTTVVFKDKNRRDWLADELGLPLGMNAFRVSASACKKGEWWKDGCHTYGYFDSVDAAKDAYRSLVASKVFELENEADGLRKAAERLCK